MPKASNPPAKPQASFGIIGLAVMGQNLALNVASKGFTCAVYNRTAARTKEMVEGPAKGNKRILPSYSLKAFVASI